MAASNTRFTQNSLGQSKNPIDSDHGIYRDQKDLAMQAAELLKSRNPHSVVEIKDLQNGAVIHPVAAGIPHLGAAHCSPPSYLTDRGFGSPRANASACSATISTLRGCHGLGM
jgi:hypothetical protein